MRQLRTTSRADLEIVDGGVWFEQQRPGLGSDFLEMVDGALSEITHRPLGCPTLTIEGTDLKVQLRWLQLGRFPQIVIFEVTNEEVVVYAVVQSHCDLAKLLRERIGVR